MRFWYSYYDLLPKEGDRGSSSVRQGALLKVRWPDGVVGYGDCCPLPEQGDPNVTLQLYDLARGRISPLLEQTIWLVRRDGVARSEGRNLLRGMPRVRNTFLIRDVAAFDEARLGAAKGYGFVSVKLKCGNDPGKEITLIEKLTKQLGFTVRLDFNSKLTYKEYKSFVDKIPVGLVQRIEFVEDPFPFDAAAWIEANKMIPIAADFEWSKIDWDQLGGKLPVRTVIMKPARLDIPKTIDWVNRYGLRMVITSSLDHPVGIMHAASIAGEVKKQYPNMLLDCGCFTHVEYKTNEFSALMPKNGPMLSELPGTGIGFNDLLENVSWVELRPATGN